MTVKHANPCGVAVAFNRPLAPVVQADALGALAAKQNGRVLCAVGLGDGVAQAQRAAYALVGCLHWGDMQFRRDIGWRAL